MRELFEGAPTTWLFSLHEQERSNLRVRVHICSLLAFLLTLHLPSQFCGLPGQDRARTSVADATVHTLARSLFSAQVLQAVGTASALSFRRHGAWLPRLLFVASVFQCQCTVSGFFLTAVVATVGLNPALNHVPQKRCSFFGKCN